MIARIQSSDLICMDEAGSTVRKAATNKQAKPTYSLLHTTNMPQGQAVSESIQWIVVHLSAAMSTDEISGYTNLSDCKVWDILVNFNKTGDIGVLKHKQPTLHKSLWGEDCLGWSQLPSPTLVCPHLHMPSIVLVFDHIIYLVDPTHACFFAAIHVCWHSVLATHNQDEILNL